MTTLQLPVEIVDQQGDLVGELRMGAAEGAFLTLVIHRGDILNVRNVQGGTVENPNLDIGAGSAANRGDVVFNWDVGRGVKIFGGRKNVLMSVNPAGDGRIHSHVPHRFHAGAMVPSGTGGWRRL